MLATSGKKAVSAFNAQQERAFQRYETATLYRNYAIRRRDSRYITSALKEGRPKLEIDQKQLDSDGYLLNTPSGTYDLRRGLDEVREHCADDHKMTAVDPSDEGKDLWQSALHTFLGDELVNYVQKSLGAAIGKVCIELLSPLTVKAETEESLLEYNSQSTWTIRKHVCRYTDGRMQAKRQA